MTRSKLTKGLVAGAAAALTITSVAAVPATALAQTNTYYDACKRSTATRTTVGGVTGAAIGAFAGSQMAARGVRTEGAVLGGLLGAALGVKVGKDTAACSSAHATPYAQPAYTPQRYGY